MEPHLISGDDNLSSAQEHQRISTYFTTYINIDLLQSNKPKLRNRERERLQRFAALFPYGMSLHFFNEPLPFFVNSTFYEMAGAKPAPPFGSGSEWVRALEACNCLDSFGIFMGRLICDPYNNLMLHCRLTGAKHETAITWCSCVVKLNGRRAFAVLTLYIPDVLPAANPLLPAENEADHIALIMSFSEREYQVYGLKQQTLTNSERVAKLMLSPNTFETYRKAVNRKIKMYLGGVSR